MVSVLVSGPSGPGSSPDQGHCVVFGDKTLYSHSASSPRCIISSGELLGVTLRWISIPSRVGRNVSCPLLHATQTGKNPGLMGQLARM